jgi:hypothetical protein
MAAHLEDLIAEHLSWSGSIVQRNVLVGRRPAGGWEMELDIMAYTPKLERVVHIEPSLDAHPWAVRERRFKKKFDAGRRFVFTEVFPWLDGRPVEFEQLAIVTSRGDRTELAGARLMTVDEYIADVRKDIVPLGAAARGAVPSKYPLLRMIQFVVNGYYRVTEG